MDKEVVYEFIRPQQYIFPTAQLYRNVFNGTYSLNHEFTEIIARRPRRVAKGILTRVQEGTAPIHFTLYDKLVYNAVITLAVTHFEATGKKEIFLSIGNIYRVIASNLSARVSPSESDAILYSLRQLLNTSIHITADIGSKKLNINSWLLLGNIVECKSSSGNNMLNGIWLDGLPVLYNVADQLNQITRVPWTVFSQSVVRFSHFSASIKDCLLWRLEWLHHCKTKRTVIRLDTIIDALKANGRKRTNLIDCLKRFLSEFQRAKYVREFVLVRGPHGKFNKILIAR